MKSFLKNYKKIIATAFLVVAVVAIGTSQATPISLGTAADFAVLGGSGVTNAESGTLITGDVGSSPTPAVSGITAGMVTGILYTTANPATASAHTDLITAYNTAAGATGGLPGPADLGGVTLTPGVYIYAAAAPWTAGTLTLDANGDPGAQWIFQIGTTLITPANATVSLINGASANNVFWQIGSSLTLGANNNFAGNILANPSITLGGGALNGRALAINGAVTISTAQTINVPLFGSLQVTKCTVTAGSENNSDKISISGQIDATADDFNDANVIEVAIDSNDMVSPLVKTFPIDSNTFNKKGKYKYSRVEGASKISFAFDAKTSKYSFSAKNVDLSGLACPLTVRIGIGGYSAETEVNETVVNGPKKPIPILLMMGVKDSLRVDKTQVKHGSAGQLSVTGGFAVANTDVNMTNRVSEGLVITLGTQTFTIPANKLKAGKGKFTCSKAELAGGGVATANFDFNKCSFTLTIKNVDITSSGTVNFGVAFAGFNEVEQVTLS